MNLRPKLTYANVAATVALILAIGGGTVYAAIHLSKNSVKSKSIAPGAVKTSDLGKNAVTSPKIKDGGVTGADIAPGLIRSVSADVTGTATGGPQAGFNTNGTAPLPLTGTTTFTPQPNGVAAIAAEGQFTFATSNSAQACQPAVALFVNGQFTRVFLSPDPGNGPTFSTTPITRNGYDADGPFGLISPGTPLTITAQTRGDSDCTAGTQLDKLVIRIVQIH
jgi:hypothetical protein